MSSARALGAIPVVLVAFLMSAGAVLADTELGETGTPGYHFLHDTSADPGALCHYSPDTQTMTGITVRFPNVDAQDLIHGTEQHRVGWRIIVKARLNIKTAWTRIFRSTVVKKLAYDSSPALFVDRLVHPTLLDDPDGTARYQVQVKMFWYAADGSVAATSLHRVDNYVEDGLDTTPVMYCTNQYVR